MKKSFGTSTLLGAMCLTLMPIAPACAANWVYVATSKTDTDFYYDSDTIQRSGNEVTVWTKLDHSRDKTVKQRERKARMRYDCADRTTTALQLTNYYADESNETFNFKSYQQEVQAVTPDTVQEDMLEAVCR